MNKFLLSMVVAVIIFSNSMSAVQDGTDGTLIVKRTEDFKITGKGDSRHWEKTDWVNIPQRSVKPVSYETKVKVLYSGTGLYFLYDCEDRKLTTTMKADNLNLWEEDVVEVFLWPQEDFPVYFEYELSPMNYELPILVPNYNGKFLGWLPWNYEGEKMTRRATSVRGGKKKRGAEVTAWVAEFFIPYKLLEPLPNIPPEPGTVWRANMYRIDYDQGPTTFSWQETTGTFHDYNRFGTFIFE